MADYDAFDDRFWSLVIGSAAIERLWSGGRWVEGPVYVPAAKAVVWSDIPEDRLMRYDETSGAVSVFEHPCGYHNGHTLDAFGRIVACEHGGRRISRLGFDGRWQTIVDRFEGRRLNSPNDVVVKSDGSIWFSDPSYGIDSDYEGHAAVSEIGACHVYRHDPESGETTAVITSLSRPNGLAFSPDERILYVSDTGATHVSGHPRAIHAFDMAADGRAVAGTGRPFASTDADLFDGFRVDTAGNIWTSCGDGVCVYAADGTFLGRINIPGPVSNLCFGGAKRNRLYITAKTSLYAVYVHATPAGWARSSA